MAPTEYEHIGLPGESKMHMAGNLLFSMKADDEIRKKGIVWIQRGGRYVDTWKWIAHVTERI